MKSSSVRISDTLAIGGGAPLAIIAGPCVIESREHCLKIAAELSALAKELALPLVFKSSFDKANRTSNSSFRGLGRAEGLAILSEVKSKYKLPVISDVHSEEDIVEAAKVLDILQIPAFLCRQTDLLQAAGRARKPVLIKKGQFLHPEDMEFAATKVEQAGGQGVLLCERGACFGYRDLVVDYRSLLIMAKTARPVVFDATHSVQQMGGPAGRSGGNREYVAHLARAAVAVGVDAVFLECHDNPSAAPSDGPNMLQMDSLAVLLKDLKALSELDLKTRV